MKIIAEELLSEMKQGKAIEEQHGDLTFKHHETLTTWKILSSIRTIDRAQEEVMHLEGEEREEDPRQFRIMTRKIHTSTTNIMEEVISPKRVQKPKRT
jgi:ABC-type dipeptide/oligopeptide/nickel transport system ATPase component